MKYHEIARKFKDKEIEIFSTADFEKIASLSKKSAWAALGRYVKMGLIKSPKRGLYYFADNPPDPHLLANKIYLPSYISFETALSYYSIIPEVVYSVTSATTKTTRMFDDNGIAFVYYKIKKQAFTGYSKKGNCLMAEPEKALVDYLYFVTLGKKSLNDRLDTSNLNKSKILEYTKLFNSQKLEKIISKAWPAWPAKNI